MRIYDLPERHPSTQQAMRWFATGHMSDIGSRDIVQSCEDLALTVIARVNDDPELTAGLRKLLEAKDAFVRAHVATHQRPDGA